MAILGICSADMPSVGSILGDNKLNCKCIVRIDSVKAPEQSPLVSEVVLNARPLTGDLILRLHQHHIQQGDRHRLYFSHTGPYTLKCKDNSRL